MNKYELLQEAISPFQKYCYGFGSSSSKVNGYILGFVCSAVKAKKFLGHTGSQVLDQINAFDIAEVHGANIGQINMIKVSSFCGPTGLIWGYHIAKASKLYRNHPFGVSTPSLDSSVKVYSADPLISAFRQLVGTVECRHFPILPGSHVPSAYKVINGEEGEHIFSAIAIGITKNRETSANLLMEDVGYIPNSIYTSLELYKYKKKITEQIANSVIIIGNNQKVEYKEIFITISTVRVKRGEIGCALIAAPYITLAQDAINIGDGRTLFDLDINQWSKCVKAHFLDH